MTAPPDMGLRMAAAALAWLLGIGLQLQQTALWSADTYIVLTLAALPVLAAWLGLAGGSASRWRLLPCLLALAMLGFGSTGWRATWRLAQTLPAQLEGRDLQLVGVVARMPQLGPTGVRFVFQVEQASLAGERVVVPERITLGWDRGFDGEALIASPEQELRAGQRWLLTVRLRQPHGSLNPHGFDLELWLFEQGIRATGTVRAAVVFPLCLRGVVNDLVAEFQCGVQER